MLTSAFFRRLFVPYLLLTCIAIAGVGIFAAVRMRSIYHEGKAETLRKNLALVTDLISPTLAGQNPSALNQQVHRLSQQIDCRLTIIARDGVVLADSEADPATMANHRDRPEISAAFEAGEGASQRLSPTLQKDMLYMAQRLTTTDGSTYCIRLAIKVYDLSAHLRVLYLGLGSFGLLAMLLVGFICYHFARRISRPIVELTEVAGDLADGKLNRRSSLAGPGELGTLARTLNHMADSLRGLLQQTARDKAEVLTILSSMAEGVIATDNQQNIMVINEAAGQLLDIDTGAAKGKPLWQVVCAEPVVKASKEVLESGKRRDFEMAASRGRRLELCLCTFPLKGPPSGMVLVAHDITQSARYQELRKEFVANVSHELRTPLTVIRGYVETLRDGAMNDPATATKYLATIQRHADQLTNLVSDLLELSKLDSQPNLPRTSPVDIGLIARKAVELLMPAAQKKKHTLDIHLPHLPLINGNADYLERAIANLLDNAIKYTPEGGKITLSATEAPHHVMVDVADNGIGIPAEDIPRIFERFYRVDRSRSREMGGTGLGLAIVKHIAQSHGGSVSVSSTVGSGSTFRLILPAL